VAIVSYETLVKQMNEAVQVKWDLLIFDEAHRLKNPKTKNFYS
jgi:SNF2 family DNA or RNA helicase